MDKINSILKIGGEPTIKYEVVNSYGEKTIIG